ncbi:MAG: hypothetical protein LBS32_07725 [Clostridiales Family XIII bacterium]|nr:hypothetical protein [Clostridiales Family XIII bacterium]
MNVSSTHRMTATALLIAIGIAIPLFSPVKFVMEPASFTLASHVAIFIAMFIDPAMGVAVAIGTTLGFQLAGFPLTIVIRAASHLVFATLGGLYLKRHRETLSSPARALAFSLVIALIHAACEFVVIYAFYALGLMGQSLQWVLMFVGVGSVIHSMVDFWIALAVYKALNRQRSFASSFGGRPQRAEAAREEPKSGLG